MNIELSDLSPVKLLMPISLRDPVFTSSRQRKNIWLITQWKQEYVFGPYLQLFATVTIVVIHNNKKWWRKKLYAAF